MTSAVIDSVPSTVTLLVTCVQPSQMLSAWVTLAGTSMFLVIVPFPWAARLSSWAWLVIETTLSGFGFGLVAADAWLVMPSRTAARAAGAAATRLPRRTLRLFIWWDLSVVVVSGADGGREPRSVVVRRCMCNLWYLYEICKGGVC